MSMYHRKLVMGGKTTMYRDPDAATLELVRQHLAIAETLRETEVELSATLTSSSDPDVRLGPVRAWDDMWTQLEQAREIAVGWGRDVRAYDDAHARSGARTVDPMMGLVLARQAREAAEDAIDALRAVFPEVVVPGKPRAARAIAVQTPNRVVPQPVSANAGADSVAPSGALGEVPDGKVRTYKVKLTTAGYGELATQFARYSAHPVGRFGTRCVCCNQETESRFEYEPQTSNNAIASKVRVPRCRDCVRHVVSVSAALVFLGSVALLASIASIVLAIAYEPWSAVVGGIGFIGFVLGWIRTRRRERKLQRNAHYSRFAIVIGPAFFLLHTSNPQLANEFAALNTRRDETR